MTPRDFFTNVARENRLAFVRDERSMRLAVNAIMTIDASVGALYAHLKAVGSSSISTYRDDDAMKHALSAQNQSYKSVQDAAAALKHGNLTRNIYLRKITDPSSIKRLSTGILGRMLLNRDTLNGNAIFLETTDGALRRASKTLIEAEAYIDGILTSHGL